jgi:hypothetical protein
MDSLIWIIFLFLIPFVAAYIAAFVARKLIPYNKSGSHTGITLFRFFTGIFIFGVLFYINLKYFDSIIIGPHDGGLGGLGIDIMYMFTIPPIFLVSLFTLLNGIKSDIIAPIVKDKNSFSEVFLKIIKIYLIIYFSTMIIVDLLD